VRLCAEEFKIVDHKLGESSSDSLIIMHAVDGSSIVLVDLKDPKTLEPRQYLVSENYVQECNSFKKRFSAWFVGDEVLSDGSLYIWTPINLVFLLLPALEKAKSQGNFCSVDHILECMECGQDAYAIQKIVESKSDVLKEVCEWKENGGDVYFKLDEDKTVAWLKGRVEKVWKDLKAMDEAFASMTEDGLNQYGIGIVSEYLSEGWSDQLYKAFGLEKPSEICPVVTDVIQMEEGQREAKRPKLDKKQIQKMKAQEARQEAKAKKLEKSAAGMKSIASFFQKKK
jgi:ribonuclease H2 subunit B